VPPAACPDL